MPGRKALILALLPIFCLGGLRLIERVDTFVVEPSRVQASFFGRIVAYPWQLRTADVWIGTSDGVTEWVYARPGGFGEAAAACRARPREDYPGPLRTPASACDQPPAQRARPGMTRTIWLADDRMRIIVSTLPAEAR